MNPELMRYLEERPKDQAQVSMKTSANYRARKWRVKDRLSERDIAELIAAFIAGTTKHELAKCFGINLKSVKNLLREAGVKKPSGYSPRP